MPATPDRATASDDHRLKRHVGMIGLLFTAVGSIIGSGWLFGAMYAAQQAGPASILSWTFGAIMIGFIGLTYSELGTMFPVSGGVVRFPHFAFGSFASYTTGWITWLAAASTAPIEVLAALQYGSNYVPWLQHLEDGVAVLTTPGYGVAAALMFLFSLINVIGIRWFARLNNALVWWKLGIIVLVIVAFLSADFKMDHFAHPAHGGFVAMGWHGVFSAIATAGIVFSYLGFRQGVELAGETDNPQRNVPIAVIGSLILCGIIYILLQIAFIGALPTSALANGWQNIGTTFSGGIEGRALAFGPLATLAMTLGMTWLALLLYIDAFVSPADTGLIYTTITARISYAMGRNGNAPGVLAKVSERGVPWVSVILAFIVGLIFFLPFPGWQKLVGFVTSATVLSFGSGPLTMMALRKELPDHARPFRLAGGWTIPFLAFLSSNLIVFWSGWDVVWKLMLAVVLGLVLLVVHEGLRGRHTPRMDFRSGFWVLPWLGGLALISWLGRYPALDKHAGNLGLLGMGSGFGVIIVFSALIMWLAHAFRLRGQRVADHVRESWGDDTMEAP
ncbi:MAG TPA: APC family permease [Rhodanobacteraceae bacterium]|jgi:amino acid transporter|nr:APC family permease [Rhodanobacteraceae bacterium]